MSEFNILLVEDMPSWRKILKNYINNALEKLECDAIICEAENLEQAWDKLENNRWDLLCTDIGLSDATGAIEGTLLVSRASEKNIPTIIISGTASVTPKHVRDFLLKDKVADFFYKPSFNTIEFVKLVQRLLSESVKLMDLKPVEQLPSKNNSLSKGVFICYSHADNENSDPKKCWRDRFQKTIAPLIRQNLITVFSDKDINTGDNWHNKIQENLNDASAAVLLISPDFLASEYIANSELPVLLKNATIRGTKIFPIIISPCGYNTATFKYPDPKIGPNEFELSSLQSANPPSSTLVDMEEGDQNRVLQKVADELAKL
ncbi:MAG: TIR domain-containing protein [Candidatus Methylumidiphilus sp.]